jgi:integrase
MRHHPDTYHPRAASVVDLASYRRAHHATGLPDGDRTDVHDGDLLDRHLRSRGPRVMRPTTETLLDEFDVCGMEDIKNPATRAEYVRMARHFADFVCAFEHDLISAQKKHVVHFKTHLQRADPQVQRLAQRCAFCQREGRAARAYSDSYVKRHLAAIRALYVYLIDSGEVNFDPSATVKRPKVEAHRQYTPSREEVQRLFDYPGTARSRLLVRLAYFAPARRRELAGLRWADIDDGNIWRFQEKGDKQHGMKLHPELTRALRDYRRAQEIEAKRHPAMRAALDDPERAYVFLTKSGKPVTPGHLVRILKRHAVRAGVGVIEPTASAVDPSTGVAWDCIDGKTSRLSPHALRRAWSSHALNDENDPVPIDVVSTVLNHKYVETTRRHYAFTDNDRAFDALMNRRLA